jgi:hypothetical protein
MAEVRNNESRFGGEYMIQDRDHMSEINQATNEADRGGARQSEQSQSDSRQQGGDDDANAQQGSGDNNRRKQQGGGLRQSY